MLDLDVLDTLEATSLIIKNPVSSPQNQLSQQ